MTALKSWYDQAFRNFKTKADAMVPPSVAGPVGAQTNMTAADQAKALGSGAMQGTMQEAEPAEDRTPAWTGLDKQTQQGLRGGYDAGGFEGVVKSVGADEWYDIPEHIRTQLLIGMRG